MPQPACEARSNRCRFPRASSVSCLVLIPMDVRRILLTHSHARTVHSTTKYSTSWFGIVEACKCSNERAKHGPLASRRRLLIASSVSCLVFIPMDMLRIFLTHSHARTLHSTPNHSNSSWFGVVGAGKY